jgi:hypothetical protein
MKKRSRFLHYGLSTLMALALASSVSFAQGHGKGNGHGHDKDKHGDDDDARSYAFNDRDGDAMRDWYRDHRNSLPPGLAKKDRLPPGLERQLEVRGTLPPGLQKRIEPVPVDLERRMPPPPPDCSHVFIGGHVVLLNHRTNTVMAVFHFEVN